MCNVIASLLYACRFEYDDPRFIRLLGLLKETLKEEAGFLPMVWGSECLCPDNFIQWRLSGAGGMMDMQE